MVSKESHLWPPPQNPHSRRIQWEYDARRRLGQAVMETSANCFHSKSVYKSSRGFNFPQIDYYASLKQLTKFPAGTSCVQGSPESVPGCKQPHFPVAFRRPVLPALPLSARGNCPSAIRWLQTCRLPANALPLAPQGLAQAHSQHPRKHHQLDASPLQNTIICGLIWFAFITQFPSAIVASRAAKTVRKVNANLIVKSPGGNSVTRGLQIWITSCGKLLGTEQKNSPAFQLAAEWPMKT